MPERKDELRVTDPKVGQRVLVGRSKYAVWTVKNVFTCTVKLSRPDGGAPDRTVLKSNLWPAP